MKVFLEVMHEFFFGVGFLFSMVCVAASIYDAIARARMKKRKMTPEQMRDIIKKDISETIK